MKLYTISLSMQKPCPLKGKWNKRYKNKKFHIDEKK